MIDQVFLNNLSHQDFERILGRSHDLETEMQLEIEMVKRNYELLNDSLDI